MGIFNNLFTRAKKSFGLSGYVGGLNAIWSEDNNSTKRYKDSTWVYSCVSLRASSVASVPWIVETLRGNEWERDDKHELNKLLARPNKRLDRNTLFKYSVQHLDLTGNAYWLKTRASTGGNGKGRVLELWPMTPGQINPVIVNDKLMKYKLANGNDIDVEDVVHLMYTCPDSLNVGQSPLQAAMRAADIDREAEIWQKQSLQNRAIPDGVMVIEDIQSQAQFEQARDQMKSQYQGATNARGPMVMGGKASWTSMSMTAAEMDFINSRKFTREEILAVYGVPHPMVGIYDNATLANIETARKIFWRDTIVPVLEEIESELNLQLAFNEYGEGVRIRHDISDVEAMQDSYTESVATARNLWSMGVPFNEINRTLELGFDDIEGGDIGYLPGGLLPSDMDFNLDVQGDAKDLGKLAYGTK